MKKCLTVWGLMACLLALTALGGAEIEKPRTLTLMVYMCGSNLESEYGSATMDLMEMQAAGFDEEKLTVLVMTGGAEQWALGGSAGSTVIRRIRPGGQQIVWQSENCDMGDPATLKQLLIFGRQKYRADDYALIFWDHGGGPLEGVCWDELFSMDGLTLRELTQGIRDAGYLNRLCWIGFDACLMGTVEVASALAPYAEYMIASQETEPAAGWDYAFLKDADGDGEKTGRVIADSYFEAHATGADPLTMACINLSGMAKVVSEMDDFFAEAGAAVSPENFADLSRIRNASPGFGETVRAVGIEGYDLVDLWDLVSRLGRDASALQAALGDAVSYSRSNIANTCGLSVYHPYANKAKYLESWRHDYHDLHFSDAYIRYTEHFGALLIGEEYVDWSGMQTAYAGTDNTGAQSFSLELTESQAAEYVSGELMIMSSFSESSERRALAPLAVIPASMDDQGILSAGYMGEALYVVNDAGEIMTGPVSFLRSADGAYYLVLTVYYDYSSNPDTKQTAYVLHCCILDEDTGELTVERSLVYDRASKTYTNRIAFSEEGFTDVSFRYFLRYLPDSGKSIRGFDEWENFSGYMEQALDLPCVWHLKLMKEWSGGGLYAVFQVTDVRQNVWSSIPVWMNNPRETEVAAACALSGTEDIAVSCTAVLKKTALYPALKLNVAVRNLSDRGLDADIFGIVLNGSRSVQEILRVWDLAPGTVTEEAWALRDEEIMGLEWVETVDFSVLISDAGNYRLDQTEIPVHIDLTGADVRTIAPPVPGVLDEYRGDDILWQLNSLEQNADGTLDGMLHVRNLSGEKRSITGIMLVNGVQSAAYQTGSSQSAVSYSLEPGADIYSPFTIKNRDTISSFGLKIAGDTRLHVMGVEQALEQAGSTIAEQVEIYATGQDASSALFSERICVLRVPEGVKLQEAAQLPTAVLMDKDGINVSLERLLLADNGIGLGLRLTNDTGDTVRIMMRDPALNGKACDVSSFTLNYYNPVMPPHTKAVLCLNIEIAEKMIADGPPEEFTFTLDAGLVSGTVAIRLPQGAVFGAAGGTELTADQVTVISE